MQDYFDLTAKVSSAAGEEDSLDNLIRSFEKQLFECIDDESGEGYFSYREKEQLLSRYNSGCDDESFLEEVFEKFKVTDIKKMIFKQTIERCLELPAISKVEEQFRTRNAEVNN